MVIGVDEVGRGSWAGPLLVVAAQANADLPPGLADSKIIPKLKRQKLAAELQLVCNFGEGWVQPKEIDAYGLAKALRAGVQRALLALGAGFQDEVVIDGNINYCLPEFVNARCEIRADSNRPIVSAASIYAKVTRDNYMAKQALKYPNYSFEKHVGYGTAAHLAALKQFGICELHRLSYKPVLTLLP